MILRVNKITVVAGYYDMTMRVSCNVLPLVGVLLLLNNGRSFLRHGFHASAVIAMTFLSVCLSVCPSVRQVPVFVQTNEAAIMRFSLSGSTIILVSGEVKIIRKFAYQEFLGHACQMANTSSLSVP